MPAALFSRTALYFLPGMWQASAREHIKYSASDKPAPEKRPKTEPPSEDDYDGYYNDRLPIDEGRRDEVVAEQIVQHIGPGMAVLLLFWVIWAAGSCSAAVLVVDIFAFTIMLFLYSFTRICRAWLHRASPNSSCS